MRRALAHSAGECTCLPIRGMPLRSEGRVWLCRHAAIGNAGAENVPFRDELDQEGPHDGGDILVEALRDLETPEMVYRARLGHSDAADPLAGLPFLLAIGNEEILQRQSRLSGPFRRCSVAPSAISAGARSPIGEPLAMLPPTVPDARTCRESEAMHEHPQIGVDPRQGGQRSAWGTPAPNDNTRLNLPPLFSALATRFNAIIWGGHAASW